jgi:hypothetical protein
VSFDVTNTVRNWIAHRQYGSRQPMAEAFSVSATSVDAGRAGWDYFSMVFESKDSADPEIRRRHAVPGTGHPPRLKIVYRPLLSVVAPAGGLPTLTSPSPEPKTVPKKTTKGVFTERLPARPAPWWVSDFLRFLLGYE